MSTLARIRTWLLGLLVLQLVGLLTELLLLEHYEDLLQWIPLAAIAITLMLIAWHVVRPHVINVRTMQAVMAAFVLIGMMGIGLHLLGAAEFQMEIDPSQSPWTVLHKALRAQAPPALAPGVMVQMGLLGLVYSYRHPAAAAGDAAASRME